jgi:1-deoxy-D-xylulose-5-phosphate synthase
VTTPVRDYGIPQRFLEHAKRPKILSDVGLTGQSLAREIAGIVAALDTPAAHQIVIDRR